MPNIPEVTKDYVLRQILEEVILVPVSPKARQKNQLIVLNPTAAAFYLGIKAGKNKEEICALAGEEFEIGTASIAQDFDEFLREMKELEVLHERPTQD